MIVSFNKLYNVLSHFTIKGGAGSDRKKLSAFMDIPFFYPIRWLDPDSEGLLVLTYDGKLQARINNPKYKMLKTYWVQVKGPLQQSDFKSFEQRILLKDGKTLPAQARLIDRPADLWPRTRRFGFAKRCWRDDWTLAVGGYNRVGLKKF